LVIDEPKAAIVREAFDLYANGATVAEICDKFNNAGYVTAKGAKFNKNSFRAMFKNERYIGIYKYKDLRIENGVPAIVDKETFDIVHKRLLYNKKAPSRGKAKVDYLLSQKLFCGHCGSNMVGESGTGRHGTTYNYYTCSKRKREKTCDKKPLKKEFIEKVVVEDALSILTPETIEELADMAIRQTEIDAEENTLIPALEKEIKDIERSINNLLKMVEKGADSESLTNRLNELEKQKRATEKRLIDAQEDLIILEKEHIIWWLTKFCEGDIEDETFRRHIIDLLINSVTVWDEPDGWFNITSVYNLTSQKTKTFRCSDLAPNTPPHKNCCFDHDHIETAVFCIPPQPFREMIVCYFIHSSPSRSAKPLAVLILSNCSTASCRLEPPWKPSFPSPRIGKMTLCIFSATTWSSFISTMEPSSPEGDTTTVKAVRRICAESIFILTSRHSRSYSASWRKPRRIINPCSTGCNPVQTALAFICWAYSLPQPKSKTPFQWLTPLKRRSFYFLQDSRHITWDTGSDRRNCQLPPRCG
ncbi:MAG: recombinase family protein, partial [Eubacteriales bacterium]